MSSAMPCTSYELRTLVADALTYYNGRARRQLGKKVESIRTLTELPPKPVFIPPAEGSRDKSDVPTG